MLCRAEGSGENWMLNPPLNGHDAFGQTKEIASFPSGVLPMGSTLGRLEYYTLDYLGELSSGDDFLKTFLKV